MKVRSLFCHCMVTLCGIFMIALIVSPGLTQGIVAHKQGPNAQTAKFLVKRLLNQYDKDFPPLYIKTQEASWKAETTGKPEYFKEEAKSSLAMRTYLSDPKRYKEVEGLHKFKDLLDPAEARALQMVYQEYKENQVPKDLLKKMVDLQSKTTEAFNTFRGKIDGKAYSQNELLDILDTSNDSEMRRKAWEALKANGEHVKKLLIELVEARNAVARAVGYKNYWEMQLDMQDFKPAELKKIFVELDEMTLEPFMEMKKELDAELSKRFKIPVSELMPWHYNNPFFQSAQPSENLDLNEFYSAKTKEDIVAIARRFYKDINLPIDGVLKRSDLYERKGKSQHAFCSSINRKEDVRTLCNVRPTAEWMDTVLHEEGHAVYDLGIDRSMRFVLRQPAQPFTTEGVAMYFGALGKSPEWMIAYADADPKRVEKLREEILKQRRYEQLTFCRFTLSMFNFEQALYENPRQNLNKLWWDMVAKYQKLNVPKGRDKADWASKMHFQGAPVYYHHYMLGEVFAAQLRSAVKQREIKGWTPELGKYFTEMVFEPGSRYRWAEFVERATCEPLSAKAFAEEVKK